MRLYKISLRNYQMFGNRWWEDRKLRVVLNKITFFRISCFAFRVL